MMALIQNHIGWPSRRRDLSESEWMRLAVERGEAILVDGSEEKRRALEAKKRKAVSQTHPPALSEGTTAYVREKEPPAESQTVDSLAAGTVTKFVRDLISDELKATKRRYRRQKP
jgi:hypothetical protein